MQHLRSLSESDKRLCSIADTQAVGFQEPVRLPHSTFLDLTAQTDALADAWEEEVTGWDHEAHEIRAVAFPSGHNDLMQHHVLVPPTPPVRAEDDMSVQEHETTHPFNTNSVELCGTSETYQR